MNKNPVEIDTELGGAVVRPTPDAQADYEKQEAECAAKITERFAPQPGTKAFSLPDAALEEEITK